MKRMNTSFVCVLLAVFLFPSHGHSDRGIKVQMNRLALVIGNGAYKNSPLKNPTNDARDMAATLSQLGFEVIYRENADKRMMVNAINEFGKKLRSADVGLFYFAGHGMQIKGRNYLIPVGVGVETESDVEFEAIDAGRLLGKMEDSGSTFNIIILDACRDNPFVRSFRSSSSGLARMDAPIGSIVAYATAPGSVAADGEGRNGLYSGYLLQKMLIPGLTIEQVFKRVRDSVVEETGKKQVPWEATSLRGDFYFIPKQDMPIQDRPTATNQTISSLHKEREQLERERLELERLKTEIEKQKLETEKEKPELKIGGEWTGSSINGSRTWRIEQRKGQVVSILCRGISGWGESIEWEAHNIRWESPKALSFSYTYIKKPVFYASGGNAKVNFISEEKAICEWKDNRGVSGKISFDKIQ